MSPRWSFAPFPGRPFLLIQVDRWNRASVTALRFAYGLYCDVRVLHVKCEADDEESMERWRQMMNEARHEAEFRLPN